MSLLMDALKKAEAEKKQAAKRLQEVEVDAQEMTGSYNAVVQQETTENESATPELFTETSQFSLEPLALTKVDEKEVSTADVSEAFSEDLTVENEVSGAFEKISEDLTLESTASSQLETVQETFEETQKVIDLSDTTIIEGLSAENAAAPFDDTFHGVVFDGREDVSELYDETLPGVVAEQLVKDLGGGEFQPTPVAAQTVFSAGRATRKQGSFKWWGVFISLALLAVVASAIVYYFSIIPASRNLPSPLIARGIEREFIAPPVILNPPPAEVVTETIINSIAAESKLEIAEAIIEEESIVSEVDVPSEIIEQTEIVESIPELEVVVEEANEILTVDVPDQSQTNIESEAKARPENIKIDSSLISISKNKISEEENVVVEQAFKAYQEGHYDAAKSIYTGVLKTDPDNRDVHLGLAAIAISNNDRRSAYSHYVHLLELNPADTLAMNGLISLSRSADPVKDESAIKLLIQREGDVPYLYFSLGNLYAKQKKWASAQQAFFDAYRLDTTNPDYVLNLAISLDQIGQYDTALDFYKTAIELSRNSPAKFNSVSVNDRILALSKLIESKL